ncbi:GNAT family N-acetyltransferase [Psychrobacillus glaciei]|uniref:GNAT family N-acetyltransferase n=1 Tax=Psychrobacillus glaciei TaxID=2283160 RepID=A0A5J6SX45_9BACI|nr:GNAT family N-acetyltransferase [Psychrobacillus glaciei]QFG00938.1 GNAT family N-acetyltransferase [Psychrobacillus glaciei]
MTVYQLISDYKNIQAYKESFNELAKMVFGIDFKSWYKKGYWGDNYVCYSYFDGNKVIANASINKMTIVSNDKEYKVIQVGTVMTHPGYRIQGLSGKLMNHIIEKYEKESDFIFLFANKSVLDFYPKFGFEKVQESSFSLKISDVKKQRTKSSTLRRLNIESAMDLQLLEGFATERIPVSTFLEVKNNKHLLMFYFILVFSEAIYYIEEKDVIVLFKHEGSHLHLFDIVSKKRVEIDTILSHIISIETEIINFHFTPDDNDKKFNTAFITDSDDTLFVRPLIKDVTEHFLFPLTSHS